MTNIEEWEIESYLKDTGHGRDIKLTLPQIDEFVAALRGNLEWPTKNGVRLRGSDYDERISVAHWLTNCTQKLSPATQCKAVNRIEETIIDYGELPLGSEDQVNSLLKNWRAGLNSSPDEVSWNNLERAIATLQSMKFGVHYSSYLLMGGVDSRAGRLMEGQ